MQSLYDLIGRPQPSAREIFAKSEEDISINGGSGGDTGVDGSLEQIFAMSQQPTVEVVPCPGAKPYEWVDGHYPMVEATYVDHTIVSCGGCDKLWKVPFEIKNVDGVAAIAVGEPEPRLRAYVAPGVVEDIIAAPGDADDTNATPDPEPKAAEVEAAADDAAQDDAAS